MRKEVIRFEKNRKYGTLFALTIPLFAVSIWGGAAYFFLMGLTILAMLFITHLYLHKIHQPLQIEANWSHRKLFPGEDLKLSFQVKNIGRFGVPSAEWHFKLSKKLNIVDVQKVEGNLKHTYRSSIVLGSQEGISYPFHVKGLTRGVAQLEDILIEVHDPFGFGKVTKEIILPKQEVVIYPELKAIHGLDQLGHAPMGETSVSHFTHEDPTYVLGARPYEYGDSFNRIDWKATAKKQELHTKIIDKTAHTELVLIGNVRTYEERWRGISEEYVERTISVLASLSHYSTTEGQPFQILINMKPMGRRPIFRINRGEGRKHLIYALESLARVSVFATLPFEEALLLAQQEYTAGKTYVLVTPFVSANLESVLRHMNRKGIPIYLIRTDEEELTIEKVGKGMRRYA
jgi:uncharacterized protein (DUF58 family)